MLTIGLQRATATATTINSSSNSNSSHSGATATASGASCYNLLCQQLQTSSSSLSAWAVAIQREGVAARKMMEAWQLGSKATATGAVAGVVGGQGSSSSSSATSMRKMKGQKFIMGTSWPALAAVLLLSQQLEEQQTQGAGANSSSSGSSGGSKVCPWGLADEACVSVFCEGLEALKWTPEDRGLLDVLLGFRVVWSKVAAKPQLQVLAVRKLIGQGVITKDDLAFSSEKQNPAAAVSQQHQEQQFEANNDRVQSFLLLPLCRLVCSALIDAMASSKKRPVALCAAVVSTGLLPQLFLFDPLLQPQLVALHLGPAAATAATAALADESSSSTAVAAAGAGDDSSPLSSSSAAAAAAATVVTAAAAAAAAGDDGDDGPLRGLLRGLLWVGSHSPRLQLVVALTLSRYVLAAPQLLLWYAGEVEKLMMFGVAGQGGPGTELADGRQVRRGL